MPSTEKGTADPEDDADIEGEDLGPSADPPDIEEGEGEPPAVDMDVDVDQSPAAAAAGGRGPWLRQQHS